MDITFILIYPAVLLAVGALMIWASFKVQRLKEGLLWLGLMFCFLSLVAVFIANPTTIQEQCNETSYIAPCNRTSLECGGTPAANACVNYTETQCLDIENCTWIEPLGDCFGEPEQNSCVPYNQTQCNGIPSCEWNNATSAVCWGTPITDSCTEYNQTQCEAIVNCTWDNEACYGTVYNCTIVGWYDPTGYKCANETQGCYWQPAQAGNCTGTVDNCTQLEDWGEDKCKETIGCIWIETQPYCTGTPATTCAWLQAYDPTGYKCAETLGCTLLSTTVNATCDSFNTTCYYIADWADSMSNAYVLLFAIVFWGILFMLFIIMLFDLIGLSFDWNYGQPRIKRRGKDD